MNLKKDKVLSEAKKMKKHYKGFGYPYDGEIDVLRLNVVGKS